MTNSDIEPHDEGIEPGSEDNSGTPSRPTAARRGILARFRARRVLMGSLAVGVVGALIVGAYILGSPAGSAATLDSRFSGALQPAGNGGIDQAGIAAAATAGPAVAGGIGKSIVSDPGVVPAPQDQLAAPLDAALIVKTGQLSLEVADLDKALTQGQSAVAGMGGSVTSSNQSGAGDYASASVTYRIPVARWDDALTALKKLGSKTLSAQTDTSDVSSQVVDLQARLDNLKVTETALQTIMARATAIPDVIAVESQLSQTQGQIEQLTAQRDNLKNQAAMSTLTVTFQLPGQTVTTQATQDWTLGGQVDQAAAALVRIGQGLATMVVWALIVLLPVGLAALVLFGILALVRRFLGRGRRRGAATPA